MRKMFNKAFTAKYRKYGYAFSEKYNIKSLRFEQPVCMILGRQDNCVGYVDALDLFESLVNDWLDRIRNRT